MELLILGEDSDDKGKQLESLTVRILKALRYQNIVANEIGAGGQEIDVRAESTTPTPGGQGFTLRVLCECKAYRSPVAITHWLKFLGKLYSEEARIKSQISGCFIALSGVNGNVAGHFDELKCNRPGIELITGERLLEVLRSVFDIAPVETVATQIAQVTERQVIRVSLCYYEESLSWLIQFADDSFTLLNAIGRDRPVANVERLLQFLKDTTAGEFVDLDAEAEARQRRLILEKIAVGSLMLLDGQGTLEAVEDCWKKHASSDEEYSVTTAELECAFERLAQRGLAGIALDSSTWQLLPDGRGEGSIHVVALYRRFFEGSILIPSLGCPFYDRHIDVDLVNAIRQIQGGMPIPDSQIEDILRLLRWSARALAWALSPDPMIVTHREKDSKVTGKARDRMDQEDLNYFLSKATQYLAEEFRMLPFHRYFYLNRNLHEIDIRRSLGVKSNVRLESQIEVRDRIRIGELANELGGGLILLRVIDDAPEPWERTAKDEDGNTR